MDYKWIIKYLNFHKRGCGYGENCILCKCLSALESLLAERDAAVEDLHGQCNKCKYSGVLYRDFPCCRCVTGGTSDYWQWRGPQKDGGGT